MMASYQYQNLPDPRAWIRVLRISAGPQDFPLSASLETVKLRDRPHYEALSYCWGSSEKPCQLLLRYDSQEYILPITKNLDLALKQMRSTSQDRTIWADAVCINQENNQEKPHQVRIMGEIYSAAAKVLVYLGEPDNSHPKAIKLLQRIHKSATQPTTGQQSTLQWIKDNKLPSVNEPWKWEPLKAFFRRLWFRRKWTIQECALASKLDFYCGTWTCDWDWMSLIIETIYNKGLAVLDYTTSTSEEQARQLQQGLSQINSLRLYRQGRQNDNGYSFQDLVYHFQTSEAKDKRDHLFALLSMAADAGDSQLDPRYGSSTVLDNCLRYAYYYLHRSQTLEVLYRAGLTDGELLAPSWIPNWYGSRQTFGFEPNGGFWDPLLRPEHLHVARGTSMSITSSQGSVVLGLKGVVIDAIADLANEHLATIQDVWRDKNLMLSRRRQHLLASDRIMSQLQSYPTGQNLESVQWRTLICNTTRSGTAPDDDFKNAYAAWRRVTLIASPPDQLAADFSDSQPFDRVVGAWNSDKVFGLTTAGFVGMFPRHTRKKDVIAVLYGGEFPFVLRPCTEPPTANYELVGQCYVHGIMEKNQLDLEKWKPQEQEILLGGDFTTETATVAVWRIVLVMIGVCVLIWNTPYFVICLL